MMEMLCTNEWESQMRADGKVALFGINAEGEYSFESLERAIEAGQFLGTNSIARVLSTRPNEDRCRGLPRCQHKFTFNEIRRLRAQWITSFNESFSTSS